MKLPGLTVPSVSSELLTIGVLERLYESVMSMPVFVKIGDAIPLDSAILNRMVKANNDKRQVGFQYASKKGSPAVQLEPYRVVYFGGF